MTEDKAPIVFKSEATLWAMMVPVNPDGRSAKPFNMRRWELADDRIYRLAWGHLPRDLNDEEGFHPGGTQWEHTTQDGLQVGDEWVPDEKEVSFVNKETGELLTFEYLGVEFADWAPGFGFLLLGKRLHPPVEED